MVPMSLPETESLPEAEKLDNQACTALLAIAHEAITHAVCEGVAIQVELDELPPRLQQPGASFVTLTQRGQLRGCMGTLSAYKPLAQDVADNAVASALRDPRFPPVTPLEVPRLKVEISVLTVPVDFPVRDEAELLQKLQPGVHGLILHDGAHRATFLPSVWEQLPDPRDFVAHLKHKAGLPADYWSPTLRCQVYWAEKVR